jgi:hypothetical protein
MKSTQPAIETETESTPILVKLTSEDLKWCLRHSQMIVDHWGGEQSRGSGTYNHNKVDGNMVGVKGELGLTRWLQSEFDEEAIKSNYKTYSDNGHRGDIQIFNQNLEVKGLRPNQWGYFRATEPRTFRRMVPPTQLEKYVKNNAILVWTVATGNTTNNEVSLKGWNYAYEVKAKGQNIQTICANVWLKHDKDMRAMESLKPVLEGASAVSRTQNMTTKQ